MTAKSDTYHHTNLLRLSDVVGFVWYLNLPHPKNAAGFVWYLNLPRLPDAAGLENKLFITIFPFFAIFDKKGTIFAERERERERCAGVIIFRKRNLARFFIGIPQIFDPLFIQPQRCIRQCCGCFSLPDEEINRQMSADIRPELYKNSAELYKNSPKLYKNNPELYNSNPKLYNHHLKLYNNRPELYNHRLKLYNIRPELYNHRPELYKNHLKLYKNQQICIHY